jgi:NAD(P)H-flavin reductase/ferredoxin
METILDRKAGTMPVLQFEDREYRVAEGESILDCLTRQGAKVPSSCRSGACQTCLMRSEKGVPPAASQAGLKPTLRAQGYFLACMCRPNEDMLIALPGEDVAPRTSAVVLNKERLNADILRLSLQCERPIDFRAGQFAHLIRADNLTRSYSLASLPGHEGQIEFHVRRLQSGAMSGWIHETLDVGDTIDVAGPFGDCFYIPGERDRGILLIGTGSGLAPLRGIIADALRHDHAGPIHLYHGSWKPDGLYLVDELRRLAERHHNFKYVACVDSEATEGIREGRADQIAFADHPSLKGWRLYLCGHPEMVKTAKRKAYLSGVALHDIYSDPFVICSGK